METVAIAGALVNSTIALEISQGMAQYIADAPDEFARRALASTAVAFAALAYAVFALAVATFSGGLSDWLLEGQTPPQTLTLVAAAIAINGEFVTVQD